MYVYICILRKIWLDILRRSSLRRSSRALGHADCANARAWLLQKNIFTAFGMPPATSSSPHWQAAYDTIPCSIILVGALEVHIWLGEFVDVYFKVVLTMKWNESESEVVYSDPAILISSEIVLQ